MSALQGCDGCDAYKTKSTWERTVRNTGSARNNSAFRRDYMPQTVKIDLNYTLSYTDKRIISYLCKCYLPVGLWCHLRLTESMGGALHIERRYWRFVFGCSKLRNFWMVVMANADVTPRGVVYTLRSVLRGLTMSSLAHFTVYLYTSTWLFLCLFLLRLWKALNDEQADASTHVFSFVVNRMWYLFVWVKANNYKGTN